MAYKVYTDSKNGVDITPGKMYDYTPAWNESPFIGGYIVDDAGFKISILIKRCFHLKGDDWMVVEE